MQLRFRNYKHKILSFEHNISVLLNQGAGRLFGFDTIEPTNTLEFKLKHTGTGLSYKDPLNTLIGPVGVIITPQGVVIGETEELTGFTIDSNIGNSEIRYDAIICEHNFVSVVGGQAATYSILKGAVGNPIKPVLSDPFKQVIVGILEIPANATDLAGVIYTKSKSPDTGDGEDARLSTMNQFKALQMENLAGQFPAPIYTYSPVSGPANYLWQLNTEGNVYEVTPTHGPNLLNDNSFFLVTGFKIKDAPLQEGTRIKIIANSKVAFARADGWMATYSPKGFKGFSINRGLCNISIETGVDNLGVRADVNELWEYEFVFYQDRWFLSKIGGVGGNSQFRRGMIISWFGDLTSNFDDTGKGINLLNGWAICNGNNGTPDKRGKIKVMSTNVPSQGASDISIASGLVDVKDYVYGDPYTLAGKRLKKILQGNIPDYYLTVIDPGHAHDITASLNTGNGGAGQVPGTGINNSESGGATDSAVTGISVRSGGNGDDFEILPPVYFEVDIMKL